MENTLPFDIRRFRKFKPWSNRTRPEPTSFPGSLFSASLGRWKKDPGCGWSCDHPESWSAFHLSGKIGFPGRKSNGTGLSTENFSKKREYLQRYSSFLVFTGITGKSLYHLLYNTSAVLLGKIHDFARENGVLLHVSVSNMRLSF